MTTSSPDRVVALLRASKEWRKAGRDVYRLQRETRCTEAEDAAYVGGEGPCDPPIFPGVPECDYDGPGYHAGDPEDWCDACRLRHSGVLEKARKRRRVAGRQLRRAIDALEAQP